MKPIKLIVGLGNPGKEYEATRHNVGIWWIQRLKEKYNLSFNLETKFFGSIATLKVNDIDAKVIIPATFMNESGKPVAACAKFFKINPEEILIIHDDLDLDSGSIRLKHGGGHGGHNGLRNIALHIGNNFARLRIGIGHPGHKDKVLKYVLTRASKQEEEKINHAIEVSMDFVEDILKGKENWANPMNKLHSI